jgi:AcrR family transcriptional regulator
VRQAVLEAANALLSERGFKATSLEAIAERAGASKVTLYRWWPNKAAVVMEAFMLAMREAMPYRETASPLSDLREHLIAFCRVLSAKPGAILASLVAEGVFDEELNQALRTRWIAPRRAEASHHLQRAIDAGEMRGDIDLETVLDALYGPLYHRLIVRRAPMTAAFAKDLWRVVSEGLARQS